MRKFYRNFRRLGMVKKKIIYIFNPLSLGQYPAVLNKNVPYMCLKKKLEQQKQKYNNYEILSVM